MTTRAPRFGATHAYVAYRACGHPIALMVDDAEDRDGLATEIGNLIRAGCHIDRVTVAAAREIGVVYCDCGPKETR